MTNTYQTEPNENGGSERDNHAPLHLAHLRVAATPTIGSRADWDSLPDNTKIRIMQADTFVSERQPNIEAERVEEPGDLSGVAPGAVQFARKLEDYIDKSVDFTLPEGVAAGYRENRFTLFHIGDEIIGGYVRVLQKGFPAGPGDASVPTDGVTWEAEGYFDAAGGRASVR